MRTVALSMADWTSPFSCTDVTALSAALRAVDTAVFTTTLLLTVFHRPQKPDWMVAMPVESSPVTSTPSCLGRKDYINAEEGSMIKIY